MQRYIQLSLVPRPRPSFLSLAVQKPYCNLRKLGGGWERGCIQLTLAAGERVAPCSVELADAALPPLQAVVPLTAEPHRGTAEVELTKRADLTMGQEARERARSPCEGV